MKRSLLVKTVFLLLMASTLSGCIWWVGDEEHRRREGHERERGEQHEEHHEDRDDQH